MASSELRRLMKSKKSISGKISHPLAKYNNVDQLTCIICTKVIQDKVVWNAHLQSKKHKENVMLLKSKASASSSSTSLSSSSLSSSSQINLRHEIAGKKSTSTEIPNKIAKPNLPADFFDQKVSPAFSKQSVNAENKCKVIPKVPQFVETGNKSNNNIKDIDVKHSILTSTSIASKADVEMKKEKEVSTADRKRKLDCDTNIPEGFFDDPQKDAKARNVEYKDPKEEEWEKFQKMIQEETKVAETIQEEEDDESAMHKDMIELNKMKSCLSRVEHLKSLVRKSNNTKIQSRKEGQTIENDDSSSDSDEDIDTMFDWRAKTLTSLS